MQRLRPDDDFMLAVETDATPMHIGALLLLDIPRAGRGDIFQSLRAHLLARLPATNLLRVLRRAPWDFDSPVWMDVGAFDADYHIVRCRQDIAMDASALRRFVAESACQRLDLMRPPFRIFILDNLADGNAGVVIKVHHALTDGVGFQTILSLLADGQEAVPLAAPARRNELRAAAPLWLAAAAWRFWRERRARSAAAGRRVPAVAALKAASPRAGTPTLKLSGPTSQRRVYETLSLDLPAMQATARALQGTVNDIFLAIAAGALRRYLLAIGDLPDAPLVANSARSYRRAEHGLFGNRIVALHPQLATHIGGAIERLRQIQLSMAAEKSRSVHEEALLDQKEVPFGPRHRRRKVAARLAEGVAILPGNVTLSNVPGVAGQVTMGGYTLLANYPTPLLGSGRFLNITARRQGGRLDLGIMADAAKMTDIGRLVGFLREAEQEYAGLAAELSQPQAATA